MSRREAGRGGTVALPRAAGLSSRHAPLASVSIPTPSEQPVVPPPAESPAMPPDQPEITPVRDPEPTTAPAPMQDPQPMEAPRQARAAGAAKALGADPATFSRPAAKAEAVAHATPRSQGAAAGSLPIAWPFLWAVPAGLAAAWWRLWLTARLGGGRR